MTKIVVGSPSLTHHLLLYPGLGPAMLDNIGGVGLYIGYMREILDYNNNLDYYILNTPRPPQNAT
jgi:hypothetical protein